MNLRDTGFVHCFYGCGFVVRDISPFDAHKHMEDHFEVAHREELEKLPKPCPTCRGTGRARCDCHGAILSGGVLIPRCPHCQGSGCVGVQGGWGTDD